MASRHTKPEWEFPTVMCEGRMPHIKKDLYGVQFYPYTEPGVDPVFAVVGGRHIFICRPPTAQSDQRVTIRQYVIDDEVSKDKEGEDVEEDYYTCAWTKDAETGTPLLCAGGFYGSIKVVDPLTGKLLRTLSGHGGEIMDLVVSPTNPYILASASSDLSIRIWSLDPSHANQPCAAILEGDGHRDTVDTLAFHSTGRYILSGGNDHIINLWTLPEFPDENTGTNKPTRIYYPHFSTSEIHGSHVDCVAFYGDLILSKADKIDGQDNCIVLWSINNFNSKNPPPSPNSAPTTHDAKTLTRSVFTSSSTSAKGSSVQYTRLMQFKITNSNTLFTRFSLFPGSATMNPVLAFCNEFSRIFLWDLSRLEVYHDVVRSGGDYMDPTVRPGFLNPFQPRQRGGGGAMARLHRAASPSESSSSYQTGSDVPEKEKGKVNWEKSIENWEQRYNISDAGSGIENHKTEIITSKSLNLTGRYIAWSRDGQWCVVVGSEAGYAVLHRSS